MLYQKLTSLYNDNYLGKQLGRATIVIAKSKETDWKLCVAKRK